MRFPGFEGEWESQILVDLCKMQAGKYISASDILEQSSTNMYPCYGGNGLRGFTRSYNKNGKYSLIGRQGALCGNITLANGSFYATEHAIVVNPKENINTEWLYYLLVHLNLNQHATGMAQPGLSVQNLEKVEATISKSLIEQKKISKFLVTLDERIATQNKIIENQKTLISQLGNKLFSQKTRFSAPDGAKFPNWQIKRLGEIAERIKTKNSENNQNVLTISAQFGLISQLDYFKKSVSSKDIGNYYLLGLNDFAYNKSYSTGYPMGAIKRLEKYEKGVVSTLYICFNFKSGISPEFMDYYFDSGIQNAELEKIAQEGARNHGLLNIGLLDFFDIQLSIPSYNEQIAIAELIKSLRNKNDCEIEILNRYRKQKKYLLSNLFI